MAIKRGGDDSDLVWSSDQGDLRRGGTGDSSGEGDRAPRRKGGKGRKAGRRNAAAGSQGGNARPAPGTRIKVRRETSGRRGKTVTTVSDIAMDEGEIKALAAELKKLCGVGGTSRNRVIELQGDHRDKVLARLREKGLDAVAAGG